VRSITVEMNKLNLTSVAGDNSSEVASGSEDDGDTGY
jgi:hypothetical protein